MEEGAGVPLRRGVRGGGWGGLLTDLTDDGQPVLQVSAANLQPLPLRRENIETIVRRPPALHVWSESSHRWLAAGGASTDPRSAR